MKKTTLALLLSAVVATPAMAQEYFSGFDMGYLSALTPDASRDKSGFALTGGMLSYTDEVGDYMEENADSKRVFQLGTDYTFSQGLILGLTSTAMNKLDDDQDIGSVSFFGGYELDCGVRLKAGLGYTVISNDDETTAESGLVLGLGYVFANGIIVEGAYTDVDVSGHQYGNTAISVGYKF